MSQAQAVGSATEAGGAVASTGQGSGGGGASNLSLSTSISSLEDLKSKSPQLWNIMMESIAMDICGQMQQSQDRLKQMWDEANR
jgi:hypothetical protein